MKLLRGGIALFLPGTYKKANATINKFNDKCIEILHSIGNLISLHVCPLRFFLGCSECIVVIGFSKTLALKSSNCNKKWEQFSRFDSVTKKELIYFFNTNISYNLDLLKSLLFSVCSLNSNINKNFNQNVSISFTLITNLLRKFAWN